MTDPNQLRLVETDDNQLTLIQGLGETAVEPCFPPTLRLLDPPELGWEYLPPDEAA